MGERGIVGKHRRRRPRTTISDPDASPVRDLLRCKFTGTAPDQRWRGDIAGPVYDLATGPARHAPTTAEMRGFLEHLVGPLHVEPLPADKPSGAERH